MDVNLDELKKNLGPLFPLMGVWEGEKGDDIAPSDDRGTENNKYRERFKLESIGPVQNHEQNLHVLRYSTMAWRIGEQNSFHEELGYWSWEPSTKQVVRVFVIPRGISVMAGGTVEYDAKEINLKAEVGSCTYGICTNPFLDREFRILRYDLNIKILSETSFSYDQTTTIQMPNRPEPFAHRDRNTLTLVSKQC